ncbi:MAG: glycosyltransferase family 2 protein [Oscillospiraceae bacterium]|jgi:glycosyltransferase involved in cell wall biosynthesis|nr:glycosyltransferase family 2 protein [Oscillospiraceae bacterium]
MEQQKISLVIPCYNEEEALPYLHSSLLAIAEKMDYAEFELLLVNNCSHDGTLKLMREYAQKDSRFKYISFSRNFGKEASMYAGLSYAGGDYVALLDADLQDPPDLLPEMYRCVTQEGYDCAAAYRQNRKGEPFFRSMFANVFYKLMGKISNVNIMNGARDFRLMSRKVVNAILSLEESERFSKGIFGWVGFKTKWIPFENMERVAGKTKLPFFSSLIYAFKGIVAFSTVPLVISSIAGLITCIAAIIYTVAVIVKQAVWNEAVSGYASQMCVMLFGFGFTLLILGIIGQYLAQIYLEIKNRPKFIIEEISEGLDS